MSSRRNAEQTLEPMVDVAFYAVERFLNSNDWEGTREDAVSYASYLLASLSLQYKDKKKLTDGFNVSQRRIRKYLSTHREMVATTAEVLVERSLPAWFLRAEEGLEGGLAGTC